MEKITVGIEGLLLFNPKVFKDERGEFFETYNNEKYASQLPNVNFVQDNLSKSHKNVLRGLHFQKDPLREMNQYVTKLLKEVPPGGLLKCASAFNGFAIYRTNKFLNCTYDGKFNINLIPANYLKNNINACKSNLKLSLIEDCEHRSFHMQAINQNGARIRISPEIVF